MYYVVPSNLFVRFRPHLLSCSTVCSALASLALNPWTWSCLLLSAACTAVSVDSITAGEAERVRLVTEEDLWWWCDSE